MRGEAQAFNAEYMAKAKLLDLSGCSRVDCRELECCPHVQICYLHSNALQVLSYANYCCALRKLDVHGNKLQALPGPDFWAGLARLEVLHLHTNNLQNLDTAHGLSVLPRLTILSLYRNPIALHPFYRSRIVKAMRNILVLDHFAVSLEEIVEEESGYNFGESFGAFSKKLRFKAAAPLTSRCELRCAYTKFVLTVSVSIRRFVDHVGCLDAECAAARR